jgi:hypothetical protein
MMAVSRAYIFVERKIVFLGLEWSEDSGEMLGYLNKAQLC